MSGFTAGIAEIPILVSDDLGDVSTFALFNQPLVTGSKFRIYQLRIDSEVPSAPAEMRLSTFFGVAPTGDMRFSAVPSAKTSWDFSPPEDTFIECPDNEGFALILFADGGITLPNTILTLQYSLVPLEIFST